jgi:hypothetical protein
MKKNVRHSQFEVIDKENGKRVGWAWGKPAAERIAQKFGQENKNFPRFYSRKIVVEIK